MQGKENLGTPVAIKFEYHVNDDSENDSTKTGSLNQALSDIPVHPFSESLTSLFRSDAQQGKKPVISFSRTPLQQLQNFVANQLDSSGVSKPVSSYLNPFHHKQQCQNCEENGHCLQQLRETATKARER